MFTAKPDAPATIESSVKCWQPRCTCGWESITGYTSKLTAEVVADQHEVAFVRRAYRHSATAWQVSTDSVQEVR